MNLSVLAAGLGIILVDLALSGDNALVIGTVAARLPRRQQVAAIIYGGIGALVIRFALAAVATELLGLTYVRAAGGVVILIIAVRLLLPNSVAETRAGSTPDRLVPAIVTITLADVAMSLDNVLAVGALAAGNILLLAGGLTISVALLFVASALVALLVEKVSWIMDLAALVLGWTAGTLIVGDPWVEQQLHPNGDQQRLIYLGCLAIVVVADLVIRWIQRRRIRRQVTSPTGAADTSSPASGEPSPPAPRTPTSSGASHRSRGN